MKTYPNIITAFLIILLIGCDQEPTNINKEINTSGIAFSECITTEKSTSELVPSLRIIGQPGNKILVKALRTEFCCATESIEIKTVTKNNQINLEIIDQGPLSYCFCPHDIEFIIENLTNIEYRLLFIESENAYSRDTFGIKFTYSEDMDTTIFGNLLLNTLNNYPIELSKTKLGGCIGMNAEMLNSGTESNDTIIFTEQGDSLKVFVGANLTCCIDFGTQYEIVGDTLIMQIVTLNNDQCDCICYYTFEYIFNNYMGQGFYYQFYYDKYKMTEGSFNLP